MIQITNGAIKNKYVRLTDGMNMFDSRYIGGSNKGSMGEEITLDVGNGKQFQTDIDGKKKFFRNRLAIKTFFENFDVVAGDHVKVIKVKEGHYALRPAQ